MSKKQIKLSEQVMSRISREHISMKPKWYFVIGSIAIFIGSIASAILTIFLVSLISFSLKTHGPMGEIRYQQLLSTFPWWAPIVALIGIGFGIWLLKKYDFSYKKNFMLFVVLFIASIIFTGWLIDYLNLDSYWMHKGFMRGMYQQYNGGQGGHGWRRN